MFDNGRQYISVNQGSIAIELSQAGKPIACDLIPPSILIRSTINLFMLSTFIKTIKEGNHPLLILGAQLPSAFSWFRSLRIPALLPSGEPANPGSLELTAQNGVRLLTRAGHFPRDLGVNVETLTITDLPS